MITQMMPVHGTTEAKVTSVHLVPMNGWKENQASPGLRYRIKAELALTDPEDGVEKMFRVSLHIPTELDDTGRPFGLGLESESGMTPVIPPSPGVSLSPVFRQEGGEQVVSIDENGMPVLPEKYEGASTYCVARLVSLKAGARIALTEITVSPSVIQNGELAGQLAFTDTKMQCLYIRSNDIGDWDPVIKPTKSCADRSDAGTVNPVNANGTESKVPAWYIERLAAEAETSATA